METNRSDPAPFCGGVGLALCGCEMAAGPKRPPSPDCELGLAGGRECSGAAGWALGCLCGFSTWLRGLPHGVAVWFRETEDGSSRPRAWKSPNVLLLCSLFKARHRGARTQGERLELTSPWPQEGGLQGRLCGLGYGQCPGRTTFPCCPGPACKVKGKCVERTWQTVLSAHLLGGDGASAG